MVLPASNMATSFPTPFLQVTYTSFKQLFPGCGWHNVYEGDKKGTQTKSSISIKKSKSKKKTQVYCGMCTVNACSTELI